MPITRLPLTPKLPFYEFDVELDDTVFRLEFRFNGRDDAWYMKISDTEDNILRSGIKIVNRRSLLKGWVTNEAPLGAITSITTVNLDRPPNLEELDRDTLLHYVDAEELRALV